MNGQKGCETIICWTSHNNTNEPREHNGRYRERQTQDDLTYTWDLKNK